MIKFLVMDVDGTLTDGKIYMGADGEAMKAFDIKDGYALHTLLKQYDILPVIITARKSPMVEHRCQELGVHEIHQGVTDKLGCLNDLLRRYSTPADTYDFSHVAYVGDDLLDLQCMEPIKAQGGLVGCPADAAREVVAVADYVSPHRGGEGAVRDFVEYIVWRNQQPSVYAQQAFRDRLQRAIAYISQLPFADLQVGRHVVDDDFFYIVNEYEAYADDAVEYESHRKYVDVQWLYEGAEQLRVAHAETMVPSDAYDEAADVIHYHDNHSMTAFYLTPGSCVVLFPQDAHKPARYLGQSCVVKKVVGKVRIG